MQDHNNHEDFQAQAALYALGALSPLEAQAFENKLALASDTARVEVAEFDAIVAQLGLSAAEESPSPELRDQLLARIAREPHPTQTAAPHSTPATHWDVFSHEGEWVKLFEGGYSKVLFTEPTNGYVTSLLKLDPGARLPNHRHRGNEQCMIMSGEFWMNDKLYHPGDFTVALDGTEHLDVYTKTGGMVMLVSPPDYDFVAR
ncbi:MAG: cupin domain-containing protein [Blastocatellia bacterium]|nr:cupin domain-containing protein [Blastocatellia bacterium]